MDEALTVEAGLHEEGWYNPAAEFEAIMQRATARAGVGEDFATEALNDFFDSQCSGIALPARWEWSGTRVEGRFDQRVRSSVLEWAHLAEGSGIVYAELGDDDIVWTECIVYGHYFTVWGYLPYGEMFEIPGLRCGFRP